MTDRPAKPLDLPAWRAGPARYRIVVQGELDPREASRLCGLACETTIDDQGVATTTLEGVLADPAALAGVMSTLSRFQLPVLSVERLSAPAQP